MTDTIERTGPDALRPLAGHVCVGYKYRLPKIYGNKFVWGKSIPDGAVKVHAYFRKVEE